MATLIRVPSLGAAVANVVILEWMYEEGAALDGGETLVEVETDKMSMEVPVEREGILHRILAPEGSELQEGDPLAVVGDPDEDVEELVARGLAELE